MGWTGKARVGEGEVGWIAYEQKLGGEVGGGSKVTEGGFGMGR